MTPSSVSSSAVSSLPMPRGGQERRRREGGGFGFWSAAGGRGKARSRGWPAFAGHDGKRAGPYAPEASRPQAPRRPCCAPLAQYPMHQKPVVRARALHQLARRGRCGRRQILDGPTPGLRRAQAPPLLGPACGRTRGRAMTGKVGQDPMHLKRAAHPIPPTAAPRSACPKPHAPETGRSRASLPGSASARPSARRAVLSPSCPFTANPPTRPMGLAAATAPGPSVCSACICPYLRLILSSFPAARTLPRGMVIARIRQNPIHLKGGGSGGAVPKRMAGSSPAMTGVGARDDAAAWWQDPMHLLAGRCRGAWGAKNRDNTPCNVGAWRRALPAAAPASRSFASLCGFCVSFFLPSAPCRAKWSIPTPGKPHAPDERRGSV